MRLLIIFLLAVFLNTQNILSVYSADKKLPYKELPRIQNNYIKAPVKAVSEKNTTVKDKTENLKEDETESPPEVPNSPPVTSEKAVDKKSGSDFMPAFMKMAGMLVGIIIFILLSAGIFVLYKKFGGRFKSSKDTGSEEIEEPETVGEAVASFVKHRI